MAADIDPAAVSAAGTVSVAAEAATEQEAGEVFVPAAEADSVVVFVQVVVLGAV